MTQTWLTPSTRLGRLRIAQVAVVTLLALAAALAGTIGGGSATAGVVAAVVLVLAAAALTLVLVLRRVQAWGYAERAEDLLVRRGVMFRRLSVVPYGRMQFVDVSAGPFERIFGLATVRLHTAAATSDARIPGLEREEAQRLRDTLARLGESKSMGL